MRSETNEVRGKGRRQLLLLVAVFFVPLMVATLMHLQVIEWRPGDSAVHGELFDPPVVLSSHEPRYLARIYEHDFLRQRWTLLYVADANCDTACENTLILMRQVRAALGKYADRTAQAMIAGDAAVDINRMTELFPNMEVVDAAPLSEQVLAARDAAAGEWIYIVDPLGNLVMRFARDENPRAIYKDLKRLLKLSRIG